MLVHPVFHVSMLRKCIWDPTEVIELDPVQLDVNLAYDEFPVSIVEKDIRKLRSKQIPIVPVRWHNRPREEDTWELESSMREKYPYLFDSSALDLLKNVEVEAIIGPLSSMQADFIIKLGEKSHVPIISFSATSPSLSSFRSPYFVRSTQNDSSQVNTISSIIQSFGWREVVPIYIDNEFGEGIIPFLADALEKINARIPYRSIIPEFATDDQIKSELYKLKSMQTRVFIVHMTTSLGTKLFNVAKKLDMMSEGYVWIVTDAIANELTSMDFSTIESMQGVIGVKPYVPRTKKRENFTTRWKLKFQQENPTISDAQLNVFGLWAYDSATALAMAVEKSRLTGASFQKL